MGAGTNLDFLNQDFFKTPDFQLPDLHLGEVFKEYSQLADDVWARAPALSQEYLKKGRETWHAYTEAHLKRFQSLSSDDRNRFMHSGLDGAVVFLLLTMISRMVLTKSLEPYLHQHFHHGPGNGFSFSFNQAKWIFSSTLLFAIWHANSHTFFDLGVPVDLSLMLGTASALSYMIYRQSSTVKECFAFFGVPALVLMPVSITVGIMQHGPYITQPAMFPLLLAIVTAITSIYFIFEAPSTIVMKGGHAIPFGTALRQELQDIWHGSWRTSIASAPGRITDTVVHGPQKMGKRAIHAGSEALRRSGEKMTDFVNTNEEGGRAAIRAAGPILQSVFSPVYHFFEGVSLFFLGLIYRLNKFLYYLYRLVIDAVFAGLRKVPGLKKYLDPSDGHGHEQVHAASNFSGSEDEGRGRGHSKGTTPKMSRRMSRPREDGEDGHVSPSRDRKSGRRNH